MRDMISRRPPAKLTWIHVEARSARRGKMCRGACACLSTPAHARRSLPRVGQRGLPTVRRERTPTEGRAEAAATLRRLRATEVTKICNEWAAHPHKPRHLRWHGTMFSTRPRRALKLRAAEVSRLKGALDIAMGSLARRPGKRDGGGGQMSSVPRRMGWSDALTIAGGGGADALILRRAGWSGNMATAAVAGHYRDRQAA